MKITVRHVSIPMRYRFGHARAGRQVADNIVVEIELSDGARGWGESVPRDYVTGETITTVFAALTRAAEISIPLSDDSDFVEACAGLANVDVSALLGGAPAAAAAFELALLDAFARREQRSLFDAITVVPGFAGLALAHVPTTVRQTLTIGDDLDGALDRAGRLHGPIDLKLKVGFGVDQDLARGRALRARFGDAVDLRADANAAWSRVEAAMTLAALAPLQLSSVEEPLAEHDLEGCAALRRAGTAVMLDESLCSLADADRAIAAGAADLFNLRLSKCGGLFGSLRLVARATQAGIGWQLGCMVGESGILSSLGRGFVARVRGARFFESTVPARSLEADLTDAELDHLPHTRETSVPGGIGFGATVLPEAVERYTVARLVVDRSEVGQT